MAATQANCCLGATITITSSQILECGPTGEFNYEVSYVNPILNPDFGEHLV